jgi:hypothetical protein
MLFCFKRQYKTADEMVKRANCWTREVVVFLLSDPSIADEPHGNYGSELGASPHFELMQPHCSCKAERTKT